MRGKIKGEKKALLNYNSHINLSYIPAVVVPSFLNTVFNFARSANVVLGRMPSSTEIVTGFSSPVFGSTICFNEICVKTKSEDNMSNLTITRRYKILVNETKTEGCHLGVHRYYLVLKFSRSSCGSSLSMRFHLIHK